MILSKLVNFGERITTRYPSYLFGLPTNLQGFTRLHPPTQKFYPKSSQQQELFSCKGNISNSHTLLVTYVVLYLRAKISSKDNPQDNLLKNVDQQPTTKTAKLPSRIVVVR